MKSRLFLSFACLLCLSATASSQVKFNLTYQPDTKIYTVSILPETAWAAPQNIVGSAQIVLRVSSSAYFTPIITSRVEGAQWSDNAYVESPQGAAGYTFVCIALVSGPTSKINFATQQEVPLFSFTNSGGDCAGLVDMLPNDDPMVQAVRAGGFNVTQSLAVLGARGNAFSGIDNGSVECTTSRTQTATDLIVSDVQISPLPASQTVVVRWQNLQERKDRVEIVITNQRGREIFREKVSGSKDENALELVVKDWNSGLYNLRFQLSDGRQTKAWHLMVTR